MNILKKMFQFIKSIKLALIVMLIIIILSFISAIIPTDPHSNFYRNPTIITQIVKATGMNNFFSSILFIGLVIVFSLNLIICTISQIASKIKSQSKIHFGPDIIHIGLLILIVGSFITAFGRPEDKYFNLKIGEAVKLNNNIELYLKDFQTLFYENSNRVKAWVSSVDVRKNGNIINTANIKVNEPLRIDDATIYQESFDEIHTLILQSIDGEKEIIKIHKNFETGEGLKYFETGDTLTFFAETKIDDNNIYAIFHQWNIKTEKIENTFALLIGDKLGDYEIKDAYIEDVTILKSVKDPGVIPVIISFFILTIGLAITFIKKAKDEYKESKKDE